MNISVMMVAHKIDLTLLNFTKMHSKLKLY